MHISRENLFTSFIALSLAFGAPFAASARAATFRLNSRKISFDLPSTWQSAEGMLDVPLTLFAPENPSAGEGSPRAIITVYPIEKNALPDFKSLESSYPEYLSQREASIKGRGGDRFEALPFRKLTLKASRAPAAVASYRYVQGDTRWTETSYYLNCGGTFFMLKGFLPTGPSLNPKDDHGAENIIQSLRCE